MKTAWCQTFPDPGKPTDNAFIESFNGNLRLVILILTRLYQSLGVIEMPDFVTDERGDFLVGQ